MSYDALVAKKKELAALKKTNKLLRDLKNDAVKDQHWEQILQKVKLIKKYKNVDLRGLPQAQRGGLREDAHRTSCRGPRESWCWKT
jgi:hypothetical protein